MSSLDPETDSTVRWEETRNREQGDEDEEEGEREDEVEKEEETEAVDKKDGDDDADCGGAFECNICLDTAKDAVISLCGHLFCWPCLHTWLETRPNNKICPVCKAGISKEKVIPLYGRGGEQKDPREKVPPRPRGQRPEPENTGPGMMGGLFGMPFNTGGQNGFQMSFGIGAFPFGIFATNFNIGGEGQGQGQQQRGPGPGTAQFEEEQFLQKVFLWVAFAFVFWLMIA